MAARFISATAENRRERKTDEEKISDLKLGKETRELDDGTEVTLCNLNVVAEYIDKPVSQIANWLTGTDNKKTGKHYAGLFDKYGAQGVALLVGVNYTDDEENGFIIDNGERKRGRKSGKADTSLLAQIEALKAAAELANVA